MVPGSFPTFDADESRTTKRTTAKKLDVATSESQLTSRFILQWITTFFLYFYVISLTFSA